MQSLPDINAVAPSEWLLWPIIPDAVRLSASRAGSLNSGSVFAFSESAVTDQHESAVLISGFYAQQRGPPAD